MGQTIIVTGAAGFIGSHTVERLLKAGHRVFGADNLRTGRRENLATVLEHSAFTLHEIDVAEESEFGELVDEVRPTAIIHLAALVSVPESIKNPALNDRLNFQATRVVAEAARKRHVGRVVFASSAAVYGDPAITPIPENTPTHPLSPYGQAKLDSENLLLEYATKYGFVARCQRYFNVYGPRQDPRSPYSGVVSLFMDHLARGLKPTIFGDGEQTRDFIGVADVARANVLAATRDGVRSGTANICTGIATSINDLWAVLAGPKAVDPRPLHAPARDGDIRDSRGSPALAKSALDFSFEIALQRGLEDLKSHLAACRT